jgi:hypothetical protein
MMVRLGREVGKVKLSKAGWSILVLAAIVFLAGLVLLSKPPLLGHFTKSGKVPLLVGYEDKEMHRKTAPLWVFVKAECIADIDGLIPPYTSVTTYMACLFPGDTRLPDRPVRLTVHGKQESGGASNIPIEAQPRTHLLESYMLDNPIPGYRGIIIAPQPHKNSPGVYFLSSGRFVALAEDTVVKQLRCLLNWQVTREGDRVVGGSCFGFGRYENVAFDTAFAVERKLDAAGLSALIRDAIDQMLRDQLHRE